MADEEHVLVPLAEGFEELEAVTIVDVLRRAELRVTVAGLRPGPVTGSHGIAVGTDCHLDEVDRGSITAIVLPGGMPGTTHLVNDDRVIDIVRALHGEGRLTAAICAAPLVLARAGIVSDVPVTSHPSVREQLEGARVVDAPRVVKSGSVWTSQGPGTALEFALALVQELSGEDVADRLADALLARTTDAPAR